jgi:hypothetical protein
MKFGNYLVALEIILSDVVHAEYRLCRVHTDSIRVTARLLSEDSYDRDIHTRVGWRLTIMNHVTGL